MRKFPPAAETSMTIPDPLSLIRPRRQIAGLSAVLLPFDAAGEIHWSDFSQLLERTSAAGLVPAVNMDTGYVNLLNDEQQAKVLETTRDVLQSSPFVAGAFVADQPDSNFDASAYDRAIERIQSSGGTPVIFQSYGLTRGSEEEIVKRYATIAGSCQQFIAFELGQMFAPFGKIYSLETFGRLMNIDQCIGAKHSSLDRQAEWQRLQLRDAERPEFHIYTGNDLAIDMVMYGSDYLLGLSTMAPDYFALRDRYWRDGDAKFYGLNDLLQFLGQLAFRRPVPAYKHSAARFLQLRGWISSCAPHPRAARRGEDDTPFMLPIIEQLATFDGDRRP